MIRDPRSPSRDNYSGMVPVARCGWKPVECESMLEMDWVEVTAAFNRDLTDIEAQPCRIAYWFDGKHRKWTPDFRISVSTESRRTLVEVKTLKVLYPEDLQLRAYVHAKWSAIGAAAVSAGYGFVLATENEIRVRPRLDNAMLTTSIVDQFFPESRIQAGIDAVLSLPNGASVQDLENLLGGRRDGFKVAVHLAWRGLIRLDPSRKWTWETTFVRTQRRL